MMTTAQLIAALDMTITFLDANDDAEGNSDAVDEARRMLEDLRDRITDEGVTP